jgi:hypothetical protein
MALPSYEAIASQYAKSVATVQTLTGLGFTQAQIDSADQLLLTVEGAAIRYTIDGTTATTSVGHPAAIGATLTFNGRFLFSGIQIIGTGATVNATLERYV